MRTCDICNWANSETDEHLNVWLKRNNLIGIELCDSHEHEIIKNLEQMEAETQINLIQEESDESNPFEPMEQLEDEYGPCSFIRDRDLEFEMKYERTENWLYLLTNSKWKNEGAVNMEKCHLCNWENVETNESLVDYLNRNGIMDFDLCDFHERDLKAWYEEEE